MDPVHIEAEDANTKVAPKTWKNPPTVRDLKQDLTASKASHDTQVTKVKTWLDNLNVEGQAKVNTPAGSSKIVPRLIRKQAEWRYAALSEPFLSTEDMYNLSPVTFEDKPAAIQNSLVINNQFNTKIPKTRFIDDYVRTAVDEGTVIVRVGWEFEEETFEEIVPIISFIPDEATIPLHEELQAMKAQNPAQFEQEVPEELKQAHELTLADGIPYRPEITGQEQVESTRTVRNHPTLEVCDYRNVVIDPSCQGDLDKAKFVIYSFTSSLSDLERDGRYQNLDMIDMEGSSVLGDPDHSTEDAPDFNFTDKARKRFVVYEYWGFWDVDGSGIVQPFVAAWVGNVLIRMEENPFPDKKLPFVGVQYLPVRRSIYGEPDGHLLEDNQKVSGAVTRGMIDIMGKSANGQTGIRKDALDITNRRKFDKGQDYEFNANVDPRQVIYTHVFPEIPNSAQFMLALQNNEAESLTGVKAFSQGISGESLGKTATGVRGALDAASKRELGLLRRLADGMIQIGRKIISMNAVFLDEEEIVRVTNEEFVPVRRDDLAGEFDLAMSISTAEEDDAKAQELAFMLQTTGQTMDPVLAKMILVDIARLRKMPALAKRIEEYQPEPDPFEQAKQQLELEMLQAQVATEQSKAMLNQANAQKAMADSGKKVADAENVQSQTDLNNLNFLEQDSGATQARELEKQGAQARANMELKTHEAALKDDLASREELRRFLGSRASA